MEQFLRTLFLWLSANRWLRQVATRNPLAYRIASRFFAGETAEEAIAAVRNLEAKEISTTLDILGEEVSSKEAAILARDAYLSLLAQIESSDVNSDISLKLTQLGLDVDLDFCIENVAAVVAKAQTMDVFVCIDMEDSSRTEKTLTVWQQLYAHYHNVGIVIQAYLYRSEADLSALCKAGATVRLCKGAYKEPAQIAFPEKAAVDANMVNLIELMLDSTMAAPAGKKPYLAMASHDEKMIAATKSYASRLHVPPDAYEFQMLYGIRRDLQEQLSAAGYRMRAYVPFGNEWYPYFMRRMAERPANVWFVLKGILKETPNARNYLLIGALVVSTLIWLARRRQTRARH